MTLDSNKLVNRQRPRRGVSKADACKAQEASSSVLDTVVGVAGAVSSVADKFTAIPGLGMIMSGVVAASSVVKGIGSIFGIATDCSDVPFDEIKEILDKRFNEVDRKLDKNAQVLSQVSNLVSRTLSEVEATRREMKAGFKRVLDSLESSEVNDVVSRINIIVMSVDERENTRNGAAKTEYVNLVEHEIKQNELYDLIKHQGDLYDLLYLIIDKNLALPKDVNHKNGFNALFALSFGTQTYISIVFSLLDQYVYLSEYYYQKNELERFNKYFDRLMFHFIKFKSILISDDKSLLNKVLGILDDVNRKHFIEYFKHDLYGEILTNKKKLISLKEKLHKMSLPIIKDTPKNNMIVSFDEIEDKNRIKTPVLKWKKGVKVSYALQYEIDGKYSKVSDWSKPIEIREYANPIIIVDVDVKNRLIFRKFGNNDPELVAVLSGSQNKFRDIDRDLYNLAEDLTYKDENILKTMNNLLDQGANLAAVFENKRGIMHVAALSGNKEVLEQILAKNKSLVDRKDSNGYTALHIAAENNQSTIVELLINNDADVNAQTKLNGLTPLHLAVRRQFDSIVQILLESSDKIDANIGDNAGFSPLHFAVSDPLPKMVIVESLLKSSNVNAATELGFTPLHLAVHLNSTEVVELLSKQKGIDLNSIDSANMTPLHYAAMKGYSKVMEKFIRHDNLTVNPVEPEKNWTPFHFAIFFKHIKASVKLFYVNKSNPKLRDHYKNLTAINGATPLHMAASRGQEHIAMLLLDDKADANQETADGETPLHLAVIHQDLKTTQHLVEKKANLSAVTRNGSTPLHLAASSGNQDIFEFLLEKQADLIHAKDNDGRLPFHDAVQSGNLDLVKHIVKSHPDFLKARDKDQHPPLYFALKNHESDEVFNYLRSQGAKINERDEMNKTLLHTFSEEGDVYAVDLLIDNGAKTDILYQNQTFFDLAVKNGRSDVVKYAVITDVIKLDEPSPVSNETTTRGEGMCLAAKNGHLSILEYLDDSVTNLTLCHPLNHAAKNGYLDIIFYLVNDKNMKIVSRDHMNPLTPLCHSINEGHFDIMKYLARKTSNLTEMCGTDERGIKSWTPLKLAQDKGNETFIRFLEELIDSDSNDPQERIETPNAIYKHGPFEKNRFDDNDGIRLKYFERKIENTQQSDFSSHVRERRFQKNTSGFPIISPLLSAEGMGNVRVGTVENVNVNGALFLLDFFIRKLSNKKYIGTTKGLQESSLEAQARALKITERFEKILSSVGSPKAVEKFDFSELHSKVYKAIKNNDERNLLNTLCSYIELDSDLKAEEVKKFLTAVAPHETSNMMLFNESTDSTLPHALAQHCFE